MTVSIDDFWRLTAASGLLSEERCQQLRADFAGLKGAPGQANSRSVAEWLVATKVLTPYQAKILLAGRPGPFVFGPFVITDRVQQGRLSGIYRATQQGKNRVLLVFLAQMTDDAREYRHLVELAQRAAKIDNPHVTRTFRAVTQGAAPFIVVERLQGNTLDEVLAHQQLKVHRACQLGLQATLGLVALESQKLVHGAVCARNVWIDASRTARLMQFPLVAPTWRQKRHEPPLVDYLAPELSDRNAKPNTSTDVYSLGCVLYELLAGRVPFPGGTPQQRIARHQREVPQRLDALNSKIPAELADLVEEMLAKDPLLRCESASQVVDQLAPFVSPGKGRPQRPPNLDAGKPRAGYGAHRAADWKAPPPQQSAPLSAAAQAELRAAAAKPVKAVEVEPGNPATAPQTTKPASASKPARAAPSSQTQPAEQAKPAPQAKQAEAAKPAVTGSPAEPIEPDEPAAPARPIDAETPTDVPPAIVIEQDEAQDDSSGSAFPVVVTEATDDGPPFLGHRKRSKSTRLPLIVAGASSALLLIVVAVLIFFGGGSDEPASDAASATAVENAAAAGSADADTLEANEASLEVDEPTAGDIPDDGQTLWASPTSGPPLELAYLPNGAQVILVLRPAELLATSEGPKLLDALGPAGPWAVEHLRRTLGVELAQIEQLTIAVAPDDELVPQTSYVMRLAEDVPEKDLFAAWGQPRTALQGSTRYYLGDKRAYYLPESGGGRVVAVASPATMEQILEFGGQPLLRSGIEKLLEQSDASRQVTLLFTPSYLLTDGRPLLAGHLTQLIEPLEGFLANDIEAVLASAHVEPELFVELRAVAPVERKPLELVEMLQGRWRTVPERVESYVARLDTQPHGRMVIMRFPRMLQLARDYTRSGAVDGQAVLNAYLPAQAAHNLLMAAELTLLEASGVGAAPAVATPAAPRTVSEALKQKISLSFPREALDRAMETVSQEMGVPIVILGSDLQLEGITKNQSLANVDQRDQPAAEILRELLKLANPEGKLIYVVKPDDQGQETVWITTRAAAAKRGDALPAGF